MIGNGALPMQKRGAGSAIVSLFLNIGLTVSLNLAIVIMSFTVPYALITQIVSGIGSISVTPAQITLFMDSIKSAYFVIAVLNALAIIPSVFQINREPNNRATSSSKQSPVVTAEASAYTLEQNSNGISWRHTELFSLVVNPYCITPPTFAELRVYTVSETIKFSRKT